jgi:hypothetical protein
VEATETTVDAKSLNKISEGGWIETVTLSSSDQNDVKADGKLHFLTEVQFNATWKVLWIFDEAGQPQRLRVKLGITDGRETAILEGDLEEGVSVITTELENAEVQPEASSPFGNVRGGRKGGR